MWPHGLQHARLLWLSLSPWMSLLKLMSIESVIHPTILSSVAPFSSCPQSFPVSGSFPMNRLFASGGQSIGASASISVFPMIIQSWFPLGLTGLMSLQAKGLSRVFSNTTIWKHHYLALSLLHGPAITFIHDYWKSHIFDWTTFVSKVMSLLFNTWSRFVIAFLSRSKCLLISCLQSHRPQWFWSPYWGKIYII